MGWRLLVGIAKLTAISVINRVLELKILWRKLYWTTWIEWSIPPVWYTSQALGVSTEALNWMLAGSHAVISNGLALLAIPLIAVGVGAAATPLVFDLDDRTTSARRPLLPRHGQEEA
jgi:hypothetical protein